MNLFSRLVQKGINAIGIKIKAKISANLGGLNRADYSYGMIVSISNNAIHFLIADGYYKTDFINACFDVKDKRYKYKQDL